MELNITHMVEDADNMPMLSGSRAEWGADAGAFTWRNSVKYGKEHPLLSTDEAREAARQHFVEYGAWTREQVEAWGEAELQGMMCQDVAAAIREMEACDSYEDYLSNCGRLYRGDNNDWYFYLGV